MSETSLKNVSNNTKKTRESIWKQFSRLHSFLKIIAGITSGITDTISTSGNIRSNFVFISPFLTNDR
jgi:translation initiation factor 2 alpha subunit (eIF-2alpha)